MAKSEKQGTVAGIVLSLMVIVRSICISLDIILPTQVSLGLIALPICVLVYAVMQLSRQKDGE